MPRQSRGSAPPRRPVAAPSRPNVTPPQPANARPASSMAHPPANAQQPHAPQQTASQGPGLFGQMASTAAGVAVGSSIGHAVGGWFGGSSSSAPAEASQTNSTPANTSDSAYANGDFNAPRTCESQVGSFRKCMDDNQGNLTICGWYLDQLKACQSAAAQY
ncbi:hypothetical protein BJ546DRAFT_108804 [Cryomyces antarcticus]|uniref:CHCH domain-containing protein n=1 Tax=Cryomyces antarcticus TaxID=329879 RepID=A0ABR0KT87_9PEZI|nr:hypothetical protein LTR60_005058 [Cryomyces antarcticus]KAK5017061.1 hypothetical protein LTR39_001752 [Cryomyces antarcticus]KAK5018000.1 hypothetical protein LTR60_001690 [Cryomyces antarcticus]KAK5128602.1 hypothetical protein LTR16_002555 [Cryomyces antarcticus]KAK5149244.1 hypothetical protein LTR04_007293 [Oleoguttula sp. CCFEE 6159]